MPAAEFNPVYGLMSSVLDELIECAELSCEHEAFVSMGRPIDPVGSDCRVISIWADDRVPAVTDIPPACGSWWREKYMLRLTHCCGSIDTDVNANLNSGFEDAIARCFYADAERLFCCLASELGGVLAAAGDIRCKHHALERVEYDEMMQGQCYGVTFMFSIVRLVCCEPAE